MPTCAWERSVMVPTTRPFSIMPGGPGRPGRPGGLRADRLAEDLGSRGFHIYARIERRWEFADVRRAAVAVAREVERRAPDLATSKWWKEERHGVFVDYNQNAKDRTVASAYSVRPPATRGCRRRWPGTRCRNGGRAVHPRHRAAALCPARRPMAGHGRGRCLAGAAARPGRPGCGGGTARRPVAAALRQAGGRAAPGPAVQAPGAAPERGQARRYLGTPSRVRPPPVHDAADRGGPGRDQGRGDGRPGPVERAAPRGLAPPGAPGRAGGLDARAQLDLDQDPAEPAQRARRGAATAGTLDVDYDPWARGGRAAR